MREGGADILMEFRTNLLSPVRPLLAHRALSQRDAYQIN